MYLRLESLLLCFLVNSVAPWVVYSWASVSTLAHWKQRCLSVAAKINELRWESLCWVLCGNVWGMVAVVLWRLTSRMGICTRALLEISRSSMAETREEGCNMLIKKKEPKVYTFWSFSSTPGLCSRGQGPALATLISEVSHGHVYVYSQTWQGGSTLCVQPVVCIFSSFWNHTWVVVL